jgi:hypothetical protein
MNYWIDEDKLALQVAFLRDNEEYGFVGSPCAELYPNGEIRSSGNLEETGRWILEGNVFKATMSGPITRTPSLCFRSVIVAPYLSYIGAGNDTVLQAILAYHSLYARWTKPMAVYRVGGISNSHKSLEKELKYNDYVYTNRHLKNLLFPESFKIDENALLDRGDYIRLKYAVREMDWRNALCIKKRLRSNKYRNKSYSKYLLGPVSCFVLSMLLRRQQ